MTNTPLDLTPFGPLLSALGLLYWAVALGTAGLLLWWLRQKPRWLSAPLAVAVLGAFIYPVATHVQEKRQQHDEAKATLDAAMALFQERCKTAGEKITRTVGNVDGVVWMKWRTKEVNLSDQFKLDDPYGKDCDGDGCIADLLRVTGGAELNPEEAKRHTKGYSFVETIDPVDGKRYRYVGVMKLHPRWTEQAIAREKALSGKGIEPSDYPFSLERKPITNFTARYGLTWDDISTREDREHWIAGGSLKAIDIQTNEVIAQRVGYLMDSGQGSQAGFRSPWGWATSHGPRCPRVFERSWDFATKVVQPNKQGE
ncbi:MAG: hypothetical protein JF606_15125 [Burkholderiales bacterium]|jgi:hypothetical protein|nr:hypothetical protein [Burkholderiales bacterium]